MLEACDPRNALSPALGSSIVQVGSGPIWRIAKKMLGAAIPQRFTAGQPFHAGASWAMMEAGVKVMAGAFSE